MEWNLRDRVANWQRGDWRVRVDLASNPEVVLSKDRSDQLLRFSISPVDSIQSNPASHGLPVDDFYVRQSDLIVTCPERKPYPFGYQVYFCVAAGKDDTFALELWLSVQTSTLESHPQLRLNFDENFWCPDVREQLPIRKHDQHFGIMVHPLDESDTRWQNAKHFQSLLVFGRFMEKGVIRRMRLRMIGSGTSIPSSGWLELFNDFAASPLPLTA